MVWNISISYTFLFINVDINDKLPSFQKSWPLLLNVPNKNENNEMISFGYEK